MLRPMVATTAVTAAVILLAGCGGNDKKSESNSDGGDKSQTSSSSATPSAPAVPSFDPPKAFTVDAAYPVMRSPGQSMTAESAVGIVGRTALVSTTAGLTGRDVAGQDQDWTVESKEAATTEVGDMTKPMAVKLDGKEVVAIAYAETDKGNGTQKPKGLIVFQWIDPIEGKNVAEVKADLTPMVGPGAGSPNLMSTAYDAETGQLAVGVSGASAKSGPVFTVFADPKTQKAGMVPSVNPAGVLNGTVAGAKGSNQEGAGDGTIVLADGATGKITKQFPTGMNYLNPMAGGSKHGYFYASKYTSSRNGSVIKESYNNTLYSVDMSTGVVVPVKSAGSEEDQFPFSCLWDQATAVVCITGNTQGAAELVGFDDTTGKKAWGYTSESKSRVVPDVTAAFHGVVYGETEAQPVLLDAKTGQDLPSAAASPTDSATPTPGSGDTPSPSDSPSDNGTPSDGGGHPGSDMSLFSGEPKSPDAVSVNGAVYRQPGGASNYDIESVLILLKPTA